jgi:glycosyltransferase involved in cell wall biosynthesis
MGEIFLSIIIPAFNEADTIEKNILELASYMFDYLPDQGWEMIVVNDGSTDKTESILDKIKNERKWLKVINLNGHYGRGRALREGFNAADGFYIVTLDADLSYAPYHIERLIGGLKRENADIAVASAYGRGGTVKNVPRNRLWLSQIGNKVLSFMFGGGLTVLTCMVRAYRGGFIKALDLHSNDKEIHLEILSKAKILGANIIEVPADLYWRDEKLKKGMDNGTAVRRSTLKVKKTGSSHLFFALLSRPGFIFWVPGSIMIALSAIIFLITLNIMIADFLIGKSLYSTIRDSMINAPISWLTMAFLLMTGIQFFTLGFLTNQNKRNQEDTYRTLTTILSEVKKIKE